MQASVSVKHSIGLEEVAKYDQLATWLGEQVAHDLPGFKVLLALCPAETRDWQIHLLPGGEESKWHGDHPTLHEIRDIWDLNPRQLEDVPENIDSASYGAWAVPFRDIRKALVGSLILLVPAGCEFGAREKRWLEENSRLGCIVTDRIVKERRLEQMERDLDELETLKSGFMDNVNHELKTPLTSIIGFTSLALAQPQIKDIPPLPEFLNSIHISAVKLDTLISEMLVISNLASAESSVDIRQRELSALVSEFREGWLADVPGQERVRISEVLPVAHVLVDGHQFHRILLHIIRNALKFSPEAEPVDVEWLFLKGRRRSDSTDFLRVNITDHGVGISDEEMERVFQKFYQVDSSSTREQGGTGIGLALAKEFTRAMGGKLWVQSELGAGSVFSFTVPAPRAGAQEE
ncbi:MAG: HAMP domain-containing histidine kinase [bacterium]|nr:HAMP domain-containing histidine kinase [bacterium]